MLKKVTLIAALLLSPMPAMACGGSCTAAGFSQMRNDFYNYSFRLGTTFYTVRLSNGSLAPKTSVRPVPRTSTAAGVTQAMRDGDHYVYARRQWAPLPGSLTGRQRAAASEARKNEIGTFYNAGSGTHGINNDGEVWSKTPDQVRLNSNGSVTVKSGTCAGQCPN